MTPLPTSDVLSILGFFLTLIGLIGSFFYIHLSDWYREVLALETKWAINKTGDEADQKAARRECRFEVKKTAGWTTLWTSVVLTAFILLVFILSLLIWVNQAAKTFELNYIGIAGASFLIIYLGMTAFFIISGYKKARKIWRETQKPK
jgi:hypothetical protein